MTLPNTQYQSREQIESVLLAEFAKIKPERALPPAIRAEAERIIRQVICGGFKALEAILSADDAGSLLAAKVAAGKLVADWEDSPLQRAKRLRRKIAGVRP